MKEREENYNVPKIIHFIWIGRPIRKEYILNIQSFAVNSDYEVKNYFCSVNNKFLL